jgi:hypothetical protein
MKANDFLNTMGADTHIIQGHETTNAVINALTYTGLRNIRDDATHNTSGAGSVASLCAVHAATGAMVDELPIVDADPNNIADTKAMYEQLAACGAMLAAEGPNEPNNFSFHYLGNQCGPFGGSWFACAQYQRDLYQLVHTDPLLAGKQVWGQTNVGAQTENEDLQWLTIPAGSNVPLPAGTQFADVANVHNYLSGNGASGSTPIDNHVWYAESIARSGPYAGLFDLCNEYWGATWAHGFPAAVPCEAANSQNFMPKVTTETNFFPSPTQTTLQGKMIVDLYLQAARMGFANTFVYLLFNEGSQGGAFFNTNGDEGDAGNATALGIYTHNMTTILADTSSAFTLVPVSYTITNLPATGYSLLLQKSNGTYELAVWGEAFASQTSTAVTVNLGATYSTVNVYDPTVGTSPTALGSVSVVPLTLVDHPFIVEFHN